MKKLDGCTAEAEHWSPNCDLEVSAASLGTVVSEGVRGEWDEELEAEVLEVLTREAGPRDS